MKPDCRPTLVLWADTGSGIGAGHLMRLVAIAQAWVEQGGRAVLLAIRLPGRMLQPHIIGIEVRMLSSADGCMADQAREVAEIAAAELADWIAIDGYRLDDSIESILAAAGCPILAMDDFGHANHLAAELVVFPHSGSFHDSRPASQLKNCYDSNWELSGLKYVPVRQEFRKSKTADPRKNPNEPFRIVVSMGAADPRNMTELVCKSVAAAAPLNRLRLDVLLGPDYQHRTSLERSLDASNVEFVLHSHVAEPGIVFNAADLVVSAGGSTLYDLACLGVPAIAVEIAENQRPVIRSMTQAGCAVAATGEGESLVETVGGLVRDLTASPPRLREMKINGPLAVDGRGASRIVRRMRAGRLVVRPAKSADCDALWQLRNDPQIRANSRSTSPVGLVEHQQWLEHVLADPKRQLFVLESAGGKISGQCRLDIDAENASGTISVSLATEMRGCSVAKGFVAHVIRQVFSKTLPGPAPAALLAWIRRENEASLRLFESLGFDRQREEIRDSGELLKYSLTFPEEDSNCGAGDVTPEFCHADRA